MTPRDVILAYPTWTITLGMSAAMNWALGGSRTTDQLLLDLIVCGLSTATGLAGAGLWWHLRQGN